MEKLPQELASMIAVDLDLVSTGALRQTSKSCSRAFTPIFLQFLKHQKTDLSRAGLQRLRNLADSPTLSKAVTTLKLTCLYFHYDLGTHNIYTYVPPSTCFWDPPTSVVNNPCRSKVIREWVKDQRAQQEDFKGEDMFCSLSRSLKNLVHLRDICLEATVVCDGDTRQAPEDVPSLRWREFWTGAIQSYRVLMLSIASAGIRLDGLTIYQATKKCSIPTHEVLEPTLLSVIQRENLENFAAHLKSFSISLATTTLPIRPRPSCCGLSDDPIQGSPYERFDISRGYNLHADDHRVDLLAEMDDVARLLHMMPNLESLHMHLCTTVNGLLSPTYYENFLAVLFPDGQYFPKLSHLVLRGFRTSQVQLDNALAPHMVQLRTLELENITLTRGSWLPILSLLNRDAEQLDKLRLSALWSTESYGNRMNLAPEFQICQGTSSSDVEADSAQSERVSYTRDIEGEEVRRPDWLRFQSTPVTVTDFGKTSGNAAWYTQHRADYGPY